MYNILNFFLTHSSEDHALLLLSVGCVNVLTWRLEKPYLLDIVCLIGVVRLPLRYTQTSIVYMIQSSFWHER